MIRVICRYWAGLGAMAIFIGAMVWIWPVKFGLSERGGVNKSIDTSAALEEGRPISVDCDVYWYMSGIDRIFPAFLSGVSWTQGRILNEQETKQILAFKGRRGRMIEGLANIRFNDPVGIQHGVVSSSYSFQWSEQKHQFIMINEDVNPCLILELKRKASGTGVVIEFHATRRVYSNGDQFSWPDFPPGVDGHYQWYYEAEAQGEWPEDRDGIYAVKFSGNGKPNTETMLIVKTQVGVE